MSRLQFVAFWAVACVGGIAIWWLAVHSAAVAQAGCISLAEYRELPPGERSPRCVLIEVRR